MSAADPVKVRFENGKRLQSIGHWLSIGWLLENVCTLCSIKLDI